MTKLKKKLDPEVLDSLESFITKNLSLEECIQLLNVVTKIHNTKFKEYQAAEAKKFVVGSVVRLSMSEKQIYHLQCKVTKINRKTISVVEMGVRKPRKFRVSPSLLSLDTNYKDNPQA